MVDVPLSHLRVGEFDDFINDKESDEDEEYVERNPPRLTEVRGLSRHNAAAQIAAELLENLPEPSRKVDGRKLKGKLVDKIGRDDASSFPCQHMGFYHAKSKEDLPMIWFEKANVFFRTVFIDHSMGRERGDNEEHVHLQARGNVYAPDGTKGTAALSRLYKQMVEIPTGCGHKVQFKHLDPVGQPEAKMIAYTFKDFGKAHFKFDSSDANGEALNDEYIAHCRELYKVKRNLACTICTDPRNRLSVEHTLVRKQLSTERTCSKSPRHSNV